MAIIPNVFLLALLRLSFEPCFNIKFLYSLIDYQTIEFSPVGPQKIKKPLDIQGVF